MIIYHTFPTFNDPQKATFENILGKGENAGNFSQNVFKLMNGIFCELSKIEFVV